MSAPYPPQPPGYGYPPPQPGNGSAIAITTKFFPLSFFFFFTKPNIVIDGQQVPQTNWGRMVIPVPPGQHHVHVHTPYLLPSRVGPADLVVNVPPGPPVELEYRTPMWAFSAGSLGTPPQKYNGMWVLWISLAIVILAILCCCGSLLLNNN